MKRTLEYTKERTLTTGEYAQIELLLGAGGPDGGTSIIGLYDVRIVEHHTTYTDVPERTDAATAAQRLVGDGWLLRTARYLELAGQTDMFGEAT